MEQNIQILVVGQGDGLRAEFEFALQGITSHRCVATYAADYRQAEDMVLSRRPHLVCVELGESGETLKRFTHEVHRLVPEATIAALYRVDQFSSDRAESSWLIEGIRANIQDFLRHPLSSAELWQLLDRLTSPRPAHRDRPGHVVSFVSNKGGVGTSTLAVNAACMLARDYPGRVLLIDASLQLGTCSVLLDLAPLTSFVHVEREKHRLDETLLRQLTIEHQSGLHVLAAPRDALEASEVNEEAVYRVLNLARRTFDVIVVDTFSVLDSTTLAVLDLSDVLYVVMQGMAPDVIATAKLLPIFKGLEIPDDKLRLVLNHNYRGFPGNLHQSDIEERLGRLFDHVFPYQPKLLEAANAGVPYCLSNPHGRGFSGSMANLVEDITRLGDAVRHGGRMPYARSTVAKMAEMVGGWWRG